MTGEDSLALIIRRYPALSCCEKEIWEASMASIDCYENSRKILVCRNGGNTLQKTYNLPCRPYQMT